jgi:phospholipid/cholesterol/gamma-HCH transport system permease protein
MPPHTSLPLRSGQWARPLLHWWAGWWQIVHFGAQVAVLALAPSSYRRAQRALLVRSMYLATWPLLPGFTVLAALIALVIIRIVLATSLSYGLTRYALDVLVRTLVLELIPLSAALFVAVRYSLRAGEEIRAMRLQGKFETLLASGLDPTRDAVLPRALAGMFAVVTLATVSGALTLVLAYVSLYGFSTWGLEAFTRTVGQVFGPTIVLIFALKTAFLSLGVSIIPMVPLPHEGKGAAARASADLALLARLLAVILLIEVGSLVGNYY